MCCFIKALVIFYPLDETKYDFCWMDISGKPHFWDCLARNTAVFFMATILCVWLRSIHEVNCRQTCRLTELICFAIPLESQLIVINQSLCWAPFRMQNFCSRCKTEAKRKDKSIYKITSMQSTVYSNLLIHAYEKGVLRPSIYSKIEHS